MHDCTACTLESHFDCQSYTALLDYRVYTHIHNKQRLHKHTCIATYLLINTKVLL